MGGTVELIFRAPLSSIAETVRGLDDSMLPEAAATYCADAFRKRAASVFRTALHVTGGNTFRTILEETIRADLRGELDGKPNRAQIMFERLRAIARERAAANAGGEGEDGEA